MNFLAHFVLTGPEEHLITGNFLGDFLSNREVVQLPELLQEGVRLHRRIDTFTDQHPAVLQSVRLLRPIHRKYAPVLLDVFHDYILANHWERYSAISLPDYTAGIYKVLLKYIHLMPDYLQERLPRMIADDWLVSYGTLDGLHFTFSRLKLRSSQPAFFDQAVESLQQHYDQLVADFHVFFPEALAVFRKPAT